MPTKIALNEPPRISVIICTHNRAELLRRAIESLFAQSLSTAEFEVVIVNNASTDHTVSLAKELIRQAAAPQAFRIIDEPRLGLSHARNAGLATARGPYVAFMDDDAVAEADWLKGLLETFDCSPKTAVVGGPVALLWPHAPPSWLADPRLRRYCSLVDLGGVRRPIDTRTESLAGTNIAFRRAALEEIGGFSVALGRTGNNLLSNEETYAVTQLVKNGHQAWYVPEAKVMHEVHAERMTRRWLLHRAFWQGLSDVAQQTPSLSSSIGQISRRRIDLVLLGALGMDWTKECILHELLRRPTRMLSLTRRARRLGMGFARRRI